MPALPVIEFQGLFSLRCEEPFIVPMHRISMMPTSTSRYTGHGCSSLRMSIRSPEMPSLRLCLPIELRKHD